MALREHNKQVELIKEWLGNGSINIFGLPFAGKDTHAKELAHTLNGVVLGGGDIMRNSVIPEHVKKTIEEGNLAPTDDFINIVLPYLSKPEFAASPLILSSVGRWHGEEDGVIGATRASGHDIKAVIYLEIDEVVALDRWEHAQKHATRGERADDDHHKLDTRFSEFMNKTLPVIEYYRKQGLLIQVDGRPDASHVSQNIIDALAEFAKS